MAVGTQRIRPLDLIGASEVLTSSQLQERMTLNGYGAEAARQAISRAGRDRSGLWRSAKLQLEHGERLFARVSFSTTPEFYRLAAEHLQGNRPGLARCLQALAVTGVLNRVHAQRLIAAAVVESESARTTTYDSEVAALQELGVQACAVGNSFEYLLGGGIIRDAMTDKRAIESLITLRKECLLARMVCNRLRNENFVSWNGSELPTQGKCHVVFKGQIFSALGFSFLAPLLRGSKAKKEKGPRPPCPVLIDVFGGLCNLGAVQSFVARARNATSWGTEREKHVGVIAARQFSEKAWKEARECGYLTINLLKMFGNEALNAMVHAERILGGFRAPGADGKAESEFGQFADMLEGLKSNPVVADLCAIGFELLTGLAIRAEGWESVLLGQDVPFREDRTRDVDVFGRRCDDLILIECKAYHDKKRIDSSEVKKFYTETVPACRTWFTKKERRQPSRVRAEIWTSGLIGSDALDALAEIKLKDGTGAEIYGPKEILKRLPSALRKRGEGLLNALAKGGQEFGAEWRDVFYNVALNGGYFNGKSSRPNNRDWVNVMSVKQLVSHLEECRRRLTEMQRRQGYVGFSCAILRAERPGGAILYEFPFGLALGERPYRRISRSSPPQ